MNISYANYFPSAFLLLSRDACPEKNGVRQLQFVGAAVLHVGVNDIRLRF